MVCGENWVVGMDANFFRVVLDVSGRFGESAAECEYAANVLNDFLIYPFSQFGHVFFSPNMKNEGVANIVT